MSLATRLAQRIVRLYPPAWRRRYEAELLALVEEQPATWRSVIDLAAACGRQWRVSAPRRDQVPLAPAFALALGAVLLAFGFGGIVALNGTLLGLVLRAVSPAPATAVDLAFALDGLVWLRVMAIFVGRLTAMPKAAAVSRAEAPLWVGLMIGSAALRVWCGEPLSLQFLQNSTWFGMVWRPTGPGAEPARE